MLVDLTIDTSAKYDEVILGEPGWDESPETEAEFQEKSNHHEAAEAYLQAKADAPTPDEMGMDADDLEPLSWDMLSAPSDPDLVAKMATYFDGMEPDEPTESLRAKLRLVDVDIFATVQMAAKAELREE